MAADCKARSLSQLSETWGLVLCTDPQRESDMALQSAAQRGQGTSKNLQWRVFDGLSESSQVTCEPRGTRGNAVKLSITKPCKPSLEPIISYRPRTFSSLPFSFPIYLYLPQNIYQGLFFQMHIP